MGGGSARKHGKRVTPGQRSALVSLRNADFSCGMGYTKPPISKPGANSSDPDVIHLETQLTIMNDGNLLDCLFFYLSRLKILTFIMHHVRECLSDSSRC